jgi:hypothetical protein
MQIFIQLRNINFSTCYKVFSIHGIEVVLTTRRNLSVCRTTRIVIDCVIEFNTHSTWESVFLTQYCVGGKIMEGWACGAYVGGERCAQGFGGEA